MSARRYGPSPALLAGVVVTVAALACGEVPTLPEGVAYISPVILPSPAVAVGDTLRDSLGVATPLRLVGIDNDGDTVTTITPVFVVTTVPGKTATITAGNYVVGDTLRTVDIVGQVGSRLQTPPAPLDIVRQPDSIAASTSQTARFPLPGTGEVTSAVSLGVSVTSPPVPANPPAPTVPRAGVKSIIVRYKVTNVFPGTATIPDTTLVLVTESDRFTLPTGRTSADTTDVSGAAARRIRAIPLGFDSVEVMASANDLRGRPLKGSPIRFVVTTK